jgi:hypothetical protein
LLKEFFGTGLKSQIANGLLLLFLGSPHTPPSDIVRAIMNRFSQNEVQRMASMENIGPQRSFKGVANTILAQRHFMK